MKYESNLNKLFLYMTMFFSVLKYIPFLNGLNKFVYILFALLIVINYKNIFFTIRKMKLILALNLFIVIYFGISKILLTTIVTEDLYSLILFEIIFILLVSIKIDLEDKQKILRNTSLMTLVVSTIIILYYRGSYISALNRIGENFYGEKNAIGPILMAANIYLLYFSISNKKLIFILFYFFGMLNLFLFNSRTNTISSLSVSIIIINYYIFKSRYKVLYFTSVPIFLVGIVLKIKDYLAYYIIKFLKIDYFTSVVSNYKYGILDALTAGRIESYVYAVDYFVLNPILGTGFNAAYIISDPQSMTGVHNLWLRALFYGGMIYFVIFIILITQIMKIVFKFKIDNKLVVFMLIAGLINSLFEPFAPLGPGTSYLIYWSIICLNIDIKKMNLGRSVLNENIRYKCCDTN